MSWRQSGRIRQAVDLAEHSLPRRAGVDEHGENLADPTRLVNQVGCRAVVAGGIHSIQVGDDVESRFGLDPGGHLTVLFQILVLLGHGDDDGVSLLELIVDFLQLNQLLRAKRSPERPIGGDHDVLFAEVLGERNRGPVGPGQLEECSLVAQLQQPFVHAPVRGVRIRLFGRCRGPNR